MTKLAYHTFVNRWFYIVMVFKETLNVSSEWFGILLLISRVLTEIEAVFSLWTIEENRYDLFNLNSQISSRAQ